MKRLLICLSLLLFFPSPSAYSKPSAWGAITQGDIKYTPPPRKHNWWGGQVGQAIPKSHPLWNALFSSLIPPSDPSQQIDVLDIQTTGYKFIRLKSDTKLDTTQFLKDYRLLFELGSQDEMKVGFTSPKRKVGNEEQTATRYEQYYRGIPVIGGDLMVITNSQDLVKSASGSPVGGLNINVKHHPISDSSALELAKTAVGYQGGSSGVKRLNPVDDFAISSKGYTMKPESWALVYRVSIELTDLDESYTVEVNAVTGEVWNLMSNRVYSEAHQYFEAKGKNYIFDPDGTFIYSFCAEKLPNNECQLLCAAPGSASGLTMITYDSRSTPEEPKIFHDNNCFFAEDGEEEKDRLGVTLHISMEQVAKFFFKTFNWLGWDGQGKIPIHLYLQKNIGGDVPAYYSIDSKSIVFSESAAKKDYHEFETMGHEFTHGVVAAVGKILGISGEAGPINESFADIFGEGIHWQRAKMDSCTKGLSPQQGQPLYFGDPNYINEGEPCAQEWYGCRIHHNKSIQNYMFTLLADGGPITNQNLLPHPQADSKVEGIGCEKAMEIAFGAIFNLNGEATTFKSTCQGWIHAAEVISNSLTSQEVESTTNACYAVGLGYPYGYTFLKREYNPLQGQKEVPAWPVTLKWTAPSQETTWQVQISTTAQLSDEYYKGDSPLSLDEDHQKEVTTPEATFNLESGRGYFWRVRTLVGSGPKKSSGGGSSTNFALGPKFTEKWGEWGPVQFFTTSMMVANITSPTPAGAYHPWPLKVTWTSAGEGVTGYNLYIDDGSYYGWCKPKQPNVSPTAVGTAKSYSLSKDTFEQSVNLAPGKKYYVSLEATGPNGDGWCMRVEFKTKDAKVILKSPAKGAKVEEGLTVPFEWKEVPGATAYQLNVESTSICPSGDPIKMSVTPGLVVNHSLTSLDPQPNKSVVYHWCVQAQGPPPFDEGTEPSRGVFSQEWDFKMDLQWTKPKLTSPKNNKTIYRDKGLAGLNFTWDDIKGIPYYNIAIYPKDSNTPISGYPKTSIGSTASSSDCCHFYSEGTGAVSGYDDFCWDVTSLDYAGHPLLTSDRWCYNIGPPIPTLLCPADGTTNLDPIARTSPPSYSLMWKDDKNSNGYFVAIWEGTSPPTMTSGSDPHSIDGSAGLVFNGWTLGEPGNCQGKSAIQIHGLPDLRANGDYTWQVYSIASNNKVGAYAQRRFHTAYHKEISDKPPGGSGDSSGGSGGGSEPPPSTCETIKSAPILNSPVQNFSSDWPMVAFDWSSVSGATAYQLTIYRLDSQVTPQMCPTCNCSGSICLNKIVYQQDLTGPDTINLGLWKIANIPYTWSVKAKNACSQGPESETRTFSFK